MTPPSRRWNSGHGSKIIHHTVLTAWWHAWRLNRKRSAHYGAYHCRWGEDYHDGEVAKKHWHVGRRRFLPTPDPEAQR